MSKHKKEFLKCFDDVQEELAKILQPSHRSDGWLVHECFKKIQLSLNLLRSAVDESDE